MASNVPSPIPPALGKLSNYLRKVYLHIILNTARLQQIQAISRAVPCNRILKIFDL